MFKTSCGAPLVRGACTSVAALAAAGALSFGGAACAAESGPIATQAPDVAAKAPDAPELEEVVISAPKGTAAALAPTKAPLNAIQPTSIVTRTFIEDSVADTSDYTGIVTVTPSTAGVASNGPGLSEKDATIRGFGDGEYNVRYDGIPFGDTNDPTHHTTSYFPASTTGAVEVDRGPGRAGDLGQASFGGSIELYSRSLSDDPYAQQKATYGSWNTRNFVTTLQSGRVAQLGGAKFTANFQELWSDGALSYAHVREFNQFVKMELPITDNISLTALATHNSGKINQPDNDGITLAQEAKYGKSFSMSNDPALPTYFGYNTVTKHTDFEYIRLAGHLAHGFSFEETGYTYSYRNSTLSATDTTQSLPDMIAGTYPGWGTKAGPKGNEDVAGYDKLNSYRVWGDIARASQDFAFGGVTGQARAGIWYEVAVTQRHRYDIDWTLGGAPNPIEKPPASGPIPPSDIQFVEHSGWTQYQPFLDVEIHPLAALSITPGVKYLHFTRTVDAPVASKTRLVDFSSQETFQRTTPYLNVNYRVDSQWSVYGQYAQGFLVPPLKVFYVPLPNEHPAVKPQLSTNYQLGAVYNANDLTFDADVYYIQFTNKFGTVGPKSNNYYVNLPGTVVYKGVEGEATYAMRFGLALFANGSVNSAKDDTGNQIKEAPEWTAALGLIYKGHGFTASMINKFVGPSWADNGEPAAYKINAYNTTNLVVGYDFGRFKIQGGIYNLFDNRNVTDISINDGPTPNPLDNHDQYWWQPERSFQLTLRATL